MTKLSACDWCGVAIPAETGVGRPRRYCRPSHRQRAYEARRTAQRRGIAPDEVLVSRSVWESLRDALFRLQSAAEDVAIDTAGVRATKSEYIEAVAHLTEAVRQLQDISVEPVALG